MSLSAPPLRDLLEKPGAQAALDFAEDAFSGRNAEDPRHLGIVAGECEKLINDSGIPYRSYFCMLALSQLHEARESASLLASAPQDRILPSAGRMVEHFEADSRPYGLTALLLARYLREPRFLIVPEISTSRFSRFSNTQIADLRVQMDPEAANAWNATVEYNRAPDLARNVDQYRLVLTEGAPSFTAETNDPDHAWNRERVSKRGAMTPRYKNAFLDHVRPRGLDSLDVPSYISLGFNQWVRSKTLPDSVEDQFTALVAHPRYAHLGENRVCGGYSFPGNHDAPLLNVNWMEWATGHSEQARFRIAKSWPLPL